MKAYILKPFERRPGTTIRMGLPEVTIAIGDEESAIEYVKRDHAEWLEYPLCVEIWDETRSHLIWESAADA
jgi:hypothetical protein